MTVWTLSMEEGTGGEEIAATLAAAADAPLIDREAEAAIAQVLSWHPDDVDQFEHHLPGPLYRIGLSLSAAQGYAIPDQSRLNVPVVRETTERIFQEAARWPCVLLGRAGFRIVADHPGALHVRLRAPFEWRVRHHARVHLITAVEAAEVIRKEDHARETYVKRLYDIRLDDPANFHLVIDVSRLDRDTVVRVLLEAAGRPTRASAGRDEDTHPTTVGGDRE
jgi:cytidylate kinase